MDHFLQQNSRSPSSDIIIHINEESVYVNDFEIANKNRGYLRYNILSALIDKRIQDYSIGIISFMNSKQFLEYTAIKSGAESDTQIRQAIYHIRKMVEYKQQIQLIEKCEKGYFLSPNIAIRKEVK